MSKPFSVLREELDRKIQERRDDPVFMERIARIMDEDREVLDGLETAFPVPQLRGMVAIRNAELNHVRLELRRLREALEAVHPWPCPTFIGRDECPGCEALGRGRSS